MLAGIRVVDRTSEIAGPYCAKLLGDAGAAIHRQEPDGGDPLLRWRSGGLHEFLNGRKLTDTLALGDADVLLSDRLSSDEVREARQAHPGLVVVTITPFGLDGPWAARPATEFTMQAASGSTGNRGDPADPPLAAGGRIGEWVAGAYASVATLAALRAGHGEHVDVAILDCMAVSMSTYPSVFAEFLGWPPMKGTGRTFEVPSIEPTLDDWVSVTTNSATQFADFCVMIGRPEWADADDMRAAPKRFANRQEFLAGVRSYTQARTTAEVLEDAGAFRIPSAPMLAGEQTPDMEHVIARGVYERSVSGRFRQPRTPYQVTFGAPSPPPATEARNDGLPLAGIRVLDVTAWWAGPAMSHALACLGADVIKIESTGRPDLMRLTSTKPPSVEQWWEWGPIFHGVNTNKRAVTLDLSTHEGKEVFERLVPGADVLVENFAPRVMDQFGLGWERIQELNSRMVMVRMPAFGLDGPWRDRTGFAQTMEAVSGMAWVTGFPDGPPVLPRGVCDPFGGMHAAFACLAALRSRDETGRGALVESVMLEAALTAAAEQVIELDLTGTSVGRQGNHCDAMAVQDVVRCAGDDAWVAVAAREGSEANALQALLGDISLEDWCASRTPDEVAETLVAQGIPAAAVIAARDVVANPQLRHRRLFEVEEHPATGRCELPTMPFRFTSVDRWLRIPSPTLGQHNDEVLGIVASADELSALRASSGIGERLKS